MSEVRTSGGLSANAAFKAGAKALIDMWGARANPHVVRGVGSIVDAAIDEHVPDNVLTPVDLARHIGLLGPERRK